MEKKYYYKAMNKDMKCWGTFQFKLGETYTIDSEELEVFSDKVFHFCEKLEDTIESYYSSTDRHFLIEVLGDMVTERKKSGSNKIRIVREISRDEIEEHIQDKDSLNAKIFLALYTTNIKMLETLYKNKKWEVRSSVAKNLNTPIYLLKELEKDKYWDVRFFVAKNPNTPVSILKKLAKDENWEIRRAVADNLNTPVYILEELAKDKKWAVRRVVADNPNTPVHILENLQQDVEPYVRFSLLTNVNLPIYILEELAKDEEDIVREEAQTRLKEITQ